MNGSGVGVRGQWRLARLARLSAGWLPTLALLLAACGRPAEDRDASQEGASYRRPKNAAGRADSVRVAGIARAELRRRGLTDSLVVAAFTKASNGYLLKLVPASNADAGGTSVWVDEDGSATVTQEYVP